MNKKKFIPFIIMGLVVIIGIGVMLGFIIANKNRKTSSQEIDKIQGTWEIYSYDTNPLTWPKELPAVHNQYMVFEDNHMTYYANGKVAFTADVEVDALFLRPTPTGDFVNSTLLPNKLRYNRFSDYNFNIIDESKGVQWDLIKCSGNYNDEKKLTTDDINGNWNVSLRSHEDDGRNLIIDSVNNQIKILDKDTGKETSVSYIWSETEQNQLVTAGLGIIQLYKPADNVLILVQYKDATIWELHR